MKTRLEVLEKGALLLKKMYEEYEDGAECYEDPESFTGFLGHAVHLTAEDEQDVLEVLEMIFPGTTCLAPSKDAIMSKTEGDKL